MYEEAIKISHQELQRNIKVRKVKKEMKEKPKSDFQLQFTVSQLV